MKRADAEKLIGTRVQAWTSSNGIYVGTLVEVLPSRPWRGKVRIDGVIEAACPWEVGGGVRKGKRSGDEIEVGGINVSPTTSSGRTYLECLAAQKVQFLSFSRQDEFWMRESLVAIDRLIEEEVQRNWRALLARSK